MKQGWEIKKLKEGCRFVGGYTPSPSLLHTEGHIPYFKVSDMNRDGNSRELYNTELYLKEAKKTYPAGAIVFPKNGGAVLTNKKRILVTNSVVDLNTGVAIPNSDVNVDYLYYFFCGVDFCNFVKEGTLPVLKIKEIGELPIFLPPLAEQERIVGILDKEFERIDALKANAEQNLQHAKDLFQSALKQELQPKEGWITMKLGAFAHMKAGDFIKASDIKDEYFEGAYPCYGGNGLRGYVKEPNRNGEYCLIGRQGALCGNIHIANGVFRATEHAVVVSPYQKMPIKLIYYLLVALNLNQYSTGAAQPGLSVKNIADNVSISVPPQDIWNSVALRLGVIESNCTALEENYKKTISLCDNMKQALLRKAFNGEL